MGLCYYWRAKASPMGKSSHYKIDVSERWQEGTYLPISKGCQRAVKWLEAGRGIQTLVRGF